MRAGTGVATIMELHKRQRIARSVRQQPVQAVADHCIAIERAGTQAHQPFGMPIGHAAMQAHAIDVHFVATAFQWFALHPAQQRTGIWACLQLLHLELTLAQWTRRQQATRAQAWVQRLGIAAERGAHYRRLHAALFRPARRQHQRFQVIHLLDLVGQAQAQRLCEELPGRVAQEAAQGIERDLVFHRIVGRRRQRCIEPRLQATALAGEATGGRMPLPAIAEATRIAIAERRR